MLSSRPGAPLDPDFEASVAVVEELARTLREEQLGPWAGAARVALAEAHLARGDAEKARADALLAVEVLGTDSDPFAIAGALRALGYAELALGNFDGAATACDRARRFAEPIMPTETAAAVTGLGMVAAARRDLIAAGSYFREAYRMYEALRLPFWTATITKIAAGNEITI